MTRSENIQVELQRDFVKIIPEYAQHGSMSADTLGRERRFRQSSFIRPWLFNAFGTNLVVVL